MGDDEGRVGLVVVNKIAQAAVVGLDVTLAGTNERNYIVDEST